MKRFEVLFGVLILIACDGCASLARKIKNACFL